MRWAILSGIVGNLAAYEAVLKDIQQRQFDDIYILGDLVGPTTTSEALACIIHDDFKKTSESLRISSFSDQPKKQCVF